MHFGPLGKVHPEIENCKLRSFPVAHRTRLHPNIEYWVHKTQKLEISTVHMRGDNISCYKLSISGRILAIFETAETENWSFGL